MFAVDWYLYGAWVLTDRIIQILFQWHVFSQNYSPNLLPLSPRSNAARANHHSNSHKLYLHINRKLDTTNPLTNRTATHKHNLPICAGPRATHRTLAETAAQQQQQSSHKSDKLKMRQHNYSTTTIVTRIPVATRIPPRLVSAALRRRVGINGRSHIHGEDRTRLSSLNNAKVIQANI